jgi:uncharacterized protein YeaO (DUF488 family)
MKIRVKRAYEAPVRADGKRVLVERERERASERSRAAHEPNCFVVERSSAHPYTARERST